MSKKEQGTEELAKLSKLLDKIENEIKKKREDSIYVQSEKFLEHMKKTTDVYSLVIDEVIGSLYVMGYTEHTNVLKKLFRGVQQQINSVLKFSLKYYARKSSEIEGSQSKKKESVSEEVEVLIDKRTLLPYCAVTTRGQATKQFHSTAAALRENNFSPSKSHSPSRSSSNHFFQPPAQAPYSLFKSGSGMATPPRRDFSMGNALNKSEYTYNYDDPDQQEADLQAYKNEHDQMQRDIDDLLEGRKNMENYAQNDISTNLKQVLKGLEGFKKKVKALGEGEDGEEMDENHMDFHSLTGSMMGAFEKAQKKTAKKVFGYALTKAIDSTQTNDVGTMPDPELLEAEKKFYRRDLEMMLNQKLEEITFAKKKIGLIEQDRNTLHDKYTKVSLEHAKCEQSQKEMQIRMISTEKEHDHIKSIMEEVKRGKVDRLFLSKDQEDALKKNIQSMNSPEDLTQMLMAKLKESKREAKVLKYQLEHGGQRPPSGFFDDNDDDIPSLTSFNKPAAGKANNNSTAKKKGGVQGSISKNNNNRGAVDDDDDAAGPIEAVEVEEEVMIDGKLVKVKKTVYRQLKKKIITNENGEKVEVEEYEDVDESQVQMGKDGTLVKINPGVKVTADGKKMVKVVTKDKNGKETVQWVEVPADADVEGGDSSKPVIIQSADGKILKKVVKKDKNGKEVVEWVEVPVDTEDAAKTGTIKTADGKVLKKVVKKDKNGKEVVEWVETVEGEDGTIQTADGKVLKKVVKKDKNGKEVVEWVEDTSKKGKGAKKDGIMTLQEEVEEEVTVLDENGNAIKVKRKVMKTKQVKKFVDENGEEVIEEEVIDPLTGEKKTVRRKVKDLKNAKLLADNHSDSGDSMYSAHGTKRKVKHKEIQTKFAVEDLIKSALESAGIKGEALNDINKMLAKHGVDIFNPKKVDDGDEVVMIPSNKKKIIYNKGEDVEEIEYVTKDGRVIKKKVPKGEKDDYEIDENGELKPKKKKGKGRFGSNDTDEDDKLNESMISVLSMDANGNVVKKKKLKKFVPYEQGGTKKATLDDMIRQQELLEKAGPPLTKEEQQDRAMYKAMLMKAKQDPKLMGLFKKFMKEKGIEVGEGDDFIVDFDTFKDYIKDLKDKHKRCGDGCVHLQRFYARIGFYPNWNNRVPLEMKRPDIASEKARPTKLPYITPKRLASPK